MLPKLTNHGKTKGKTNKNWCRTHIKVMSVVDWSTYILKCKQCKRKERTAFNEANKSFQLRWTQYDWQENVTGRWSRKWRKVKFSSQERIILFLSVLTDRTLQKAFVEVVQLTLQKVTFHRPQPRLANQILECLRRHCKTEEF